MLDLSKVPKFRSMPQQFITRSRAAFSCMVNSNRAISSVHVSFTLTSCGAAGSTSHSAASSGRVQKSTSAQNFLKIVSLAEQK